MTCPSRRRGKPEQLLSSIVDALLAVVVAPACAACGALLEGPTAGPVCGACWTTIRVFTPPLCSACGDPLPPSRPHGAETSSAPTTANQPAIVETAERDLVGAELVSAPRCARCCARPRLIAHARAIGEYTGTLRTLVHLLKYEGRRSIAPRLAAMMAIAGADVLRGADATVPVPLHWTRRWRRGFNQASLLAAPLGVRVWPALVRVRATSPQVALAAAARRRNVHNAFTIARRHRPWQAAWTSRLKGKTVVLVDDVSTTGATLEACAQALRTAGAREVRALTAARVAGSPR